MEGVDLTKFGGSLDPHKGLHLKQLSNACIEELLQFLVEVEASK